MLALLTAYLDDTSFLRLSGRWRDILSDRVDALRQTFSPEKITVLTDDDDIVQMTSQLGVKALKRPLPCGEMDEFARAQFALGVFRERFGHAPVMITPLDRCYNSEDVFQCVLAQLKASDSDMIATVQAPASHPAKLFGNLQAREMGLIYIFSQDRRDRELYLDGEPGLLTKPFLFDWSQIGQEEMRASDAFRHRIVRTERGLAMRDDDASGEGPIWLRVDDVSARIFSPEAALPKPALPTADNEEKTLVGAGFQFDRIDGGRLLYRNDKTGRHLLEFNLPKDVPNACLALLGVAPNIPPACVYRFLKPGLNRIGLDLPYPVSAYSHLICAVLDGVASEGPGGFSVRLPGGNLWKYDSNRMTLTNLNKDVVVQGRQELPSIYVFDGACFAFQAHTTTATLDDPTLRVEPFLLESCESVRISSEIDLLRYELKKRNAKRVPA